MTRIIQTAIAAIAILVALAVTLTLALGSSWLPNPFAAQPEEEFGQTVVHSVRELSQLTTVEQVQYTTIEKGNDAGILNRFRGDRIFLFAVARIGAGVDLSTLEERDFEVDEARKTVRLTIPRPAVQYVAMDNEATRVYDRDTGLFTKGDRDLESQARQAAEAELREQAVTSGILDRAHQNAVRTLTAFLRSLGYEQVEVVQRREGR